MTMENINNSNIVNGWEYLCDIKPTVSVCKQQLQDDYLMYYNLAYDKFIKSICIEKSELDTITTNNTESKYRYCIDMSGDNDIIDSENEYPIKFLKSKFILYKYKKLKTDLISHYKPLGFYVKGPFKININNTITKYIIELYWNTNKEKYTEETGNESHS